MGTWDNRGSVSKAQYGKQALQEPQPQVRPRQPPVPHLREPPRPDPQVQHQHLPSVLPRVREGHWLCQVPLSAYRVLTLGDDFAPLMMARAPRRELVASASDHPRENAL